MQKKWIFDFEKKIRKTFGFLLKKIMKKILDQIKNVFYLS